MKKYNIDSNYHLRTVKLEDANDIFSFASKENVTKYLTWKPHKTIDDTIWAINNIYLVKNEINLPNSYAIVENNSNKVIGIADFIIENNDSKLKIGYFLNDNYWHKGIMTKTLKKLLDIGFNELNFNEIYILHLSQNIGSKKVILNNKFKFLNNSSTTTSDGSSETILEYKLTKDEYNNDK